MLDAVRSYLFVPGDSQKKMTKGLEGRADALILDLEDAVAAENRPAARELCCEVLSGPRDKPLVVRVNGLGTADVLADLAAVMRGKPDGIMLPKCAGIGDVERLSDYLDVLEAREGTEAGRTAILPIVTETAAAVLAIPSFQRGNRRLSGLLWGGEDLAASLGAFSNRTPKGAYAAPYIAARAMCLFAAAAAGAGAIDAVYTDFRDDDGLRAEAEAALRDGFGSKAAIHPAQIDIINEVFTPSADDVAEAEAIVAALSGGKSVAALNGRLVEAPHLKKAHKILARASRLEASRRSA
jgi:citrate lyase subunit beta / citryl-CoA lyase